MAAGYSSNVEAAELCWHHPTGAVHVPDWLPRVRHGGCSAVAHCHRLLCNLLLHCRLS
jgi:hypothetical protein